jgi:pyrophosphatase PpaX
MLQGIKLIIYDLDGVLVDTNPAINASILHALDELDLEYDIDKIMEQMGTPLNLIFKDVFKEEDQSKIPEAVNIYRKYYSETGKDAIRVQDNVCDTLRYFSEKGLKQCIASNSSRKLMEPILEKIGIMAHIDFFMGVEDIEKPKPDPSIIEAIMERTGTSKRETVFIDDSSTGLGAGKKAGIHTVGITTGVHTTKHIMSVDPEFILTNISQLMQIIKVG